MLYLFVGGPKNGQLIDVEGTNRIEMAIRSFRISVAINEKCCLDSAQISRCGYQLREYRYLPIRTQVTPPSPYIGLWPAYRHRFYFVSDNCSKEELEAMVNQTHGPGF